MKQTVITFKADEQITRALEQIPNKSEFIRAAVLAALDESCPFCGGTGTLNPHQRKHWAAFLKEHQLEHCDECNGVKIHCKHHGEHRHE
ncbi:MAG: CopG family transcriptional regulator [Lentisphaeria bacterium]|nr:CopG family transcriptional regulator [Lentisphaeria bacterium]MBR3708264.1 CopG family transcriptional regulator [Lentisphaeria bacterium]